MNGYYHAWEFDGCDIRPCDRQVALLEQGDGLIRIDASWSQRGVASNESLKCGSTLGKESSMKW